MNSAKTVSGEKNTMKNIIAKAGKYLTLSRGDGEHGICKIGKVGFAGMVFTVLFITFSFAEENWYVGSEACKDCHEHEYENFTKYSKKAKSYKSIKKMKNKVTPEEYESCFECHTTGYGKAGGFISEDKTPELKDAGCEVCHGPGGLHVENEDPEKITRLISMEECMKCHDQDRVEAFDFKPLVYGGAH